MVAAHLLEVEACDVVWDGSLFSPTGVPARGVSWMEVAVAHDPARLPAGMEAGLTFDERYAPSTTYPHGTHIAAVSIDRDTGRVHVERFVAVDDAGVIVNPLLAEAQIVGGVAQGFGQALFEEMLYEADGTLVSGALGESGTVGAPPAIANAVVDALSGAGLQVDQVDFPITSEKVWRLLKQPTPVSDLGEQPETG